MTDPEDLFDPFFKDPLFGQLFRGGMGDHQDPVQFFHHRGQGQGLPGGIDPRQVIGAPTVDEVAGIFNGVVRLSWWNREIPFPALTPAMPPFWLISSTAIGGAHFVEFPVPGQGPG